MVRAGAVPLLLDGGGLIAWLWWGCSPGSLIAGAGGWLMVWLPGSGWIAWLFPGLMFPWLLSRLAGGGDWLLPVLVGCCSLVPAGLLGSRFRGGWRVTAPSMVGCSRCDSPWFGWRVLILSVPARGSMFPWWLLVGGRSLAGARWWRVLSRLLDCAGWVVSPVGGWLLTRLAVVLFDSPVVSPRGWLLLVR